MIAVAYHNSGAAEYWSQARLEDGATWSVGARGRTRAGNAMFPKQNKKTILPTYIIDRSSAGRGPDGNGPEGARLNLLHEGLRNSRRRGSVENQTKPGFNEPGINLKQIRFETKTRIS